jgi:transcriptional regulator with XRE-family HTH domain
MNYKEKTVKYLRERCQKGNIRPSALAKIVNLSGQKILRWIDPNQRYSPNFEDLERLAKSEGLTLPEFLIKHYGYPPISSINSVIAKLNELSPDELLEVISEAAVLLKTNNSIVLIGSRKGDEIENFRRRAKIMQLTEQIKNTPFRLMQDNC